MPSSTSLSVATESASGPPASRQSQGGKVPVGGIIGGAGGALILMLGGILGVLLWRRRRDAKRGRELNAGYYSKSHHASKHAQCTTLTGRVMEMQYHSTQAPSHLYGGLRATQVVLILAEIRSHLQT